MANLVLYRKHRPQTFKDVVGQEHVVRTVTSAIAAGDFAHSYLFAGPRGTGKTTLARLVAKAINCEKRANGQYEPCGKCNSCDEISRGVAVDLIEIDAASNRGIDDIRQLKEGIRFTPTRSKYKVFIIDEVHMLTKEAFNALLKTLEEPPAHAVFVLATTELNKVIPTIISRSQKFEFRKLFHREIRERLAKLVEIEGRRVDGKVLDLVASRAGGSIRDGESMLGQVFALGSSAEIDDVQFLLGCADFQSVSRFVDSLATGDKKGAIVLVGEVVEKGIDPDEFIKSVLSYVRWMMFLKIDKSLGEIIGREISQDELAELETLSAKFEMPQLQKAAQLFLTASTNMRYSPIPELPIEMAVVELLED